MAYYRNSDMVAARNSAQTQTGAISTERGVDSVGYSSMGVYGTKPLNEPAENSLKETFAPRTVPGADASLSEPGQFSTVGELPMSTGYYSTDACYDTNYGRYIGWDPNGLGYGILMSDITVTLVSQKCTELLAGVHPEGRPIVFPKQSIVNIIDSVYQSHTPRVGDIYSRYIQADTTQRNDVVEMLNRAIKIIVSQVRNEYETAENNSKLSVWTTVLGDFNEHGLQQHTQITQINNRGPNRHQISMRY